MTGDDSTKWSNLLKNVGQYDPDKKIEYFVDKFKSLAKLFGVTDQAKQIEILSCTLANCQAGKVFEEIQVKEKSDFEKATQKLIKVIDGDTSTTNASAYDKMQALNLKNHATLKDYYYAGLEVKTQAKTHISEAFIVQAWIRGLPNLMATVLKKDAPSTLIEAFEHAQLVHNQNPEKYDIRIQQNTFRGSSRGGRGFGRGGSYRGNSNRGSNGGAQRAGRNGYDKFGQIRKCFDCQSPDHTRGYFHCPRKSRGNRGSFRGRGSGRGSYIGQTRLQEAGEDWRRGYDQQEDGYQKVFKNNVSKKSDCETRNEKDLYIRKATVCSSNWDSSDLSQQKLGKFDTNQTSDEAVISINLAKFDDSLVKFNGFIGSKQGSLISWKSDVDSGAQVTCISFKNFEKLNCDINLLKNVSVIGFDKNPSTKVIGRVKPGQLFFKNSESGADIPFEPLVIDADCNLLGFDLISAAGGGYFHKNKNTWQFKFFTQNAFQKIRSDEYYNLKPGEIRNIRIQNIDIISISNIIAIEEKNSELTTHPALFQNQTTIPIKNNTLNTIKIHKTQHIANAYLGENLNTNSNINTNHNTSMKDNEFSSEIQRKISHLPDKYKKPAADIIFDGRQNFDAYTGKIVSEFPGEITINPENKKIEVPFEKRRAYNPNVWSKIESGLNKLEKNISDKISLIILANPNSPTGTVMSTIQLKKILFLAEKKNIPVLIDEAYYGFYQFCQLFKDLCNIIAF